MSVRHGWLTLTLGGAALLAHGAEPDPRASVRPTPQQLAWQEGELTMFIHFCAKRTQTRQMISATTPVRTRTSTIVR